MFIYIANHSGETIELDPNDRCENKKCEVSHYGFYAAHGKFCDTGFLPSKHLKTGFQSEIRVSSREAAIILPAGWIRYRWTNDTNAKLLIDYSDAGWGGLQNMPNVSAKIHGTKKYSVAVTEEGHRSYKVTITPAAASSNPFQGIYTGGVLDGGARNMEVGLTHTNT